MNHAPWKLWILAAGLVAAGRALLIQPNNRSNLKESQS